ncbi:MAG: hypothetical protein FMNOHCHN_01685 [Ignavibacteriaceae bacterium]|nr:hypothetical protein [Ignavibacteriaceae bacterium]
MLQEEKQTRSWRYLSVSKDSGILRPECFIVRKENYTIVKILSLHRKENSQVFYQRNMGKIEPGRN